MYKNYSQMLQNSILLCFFEAKTSMILFMSNCISWCTCIKASPLLLTCVIDALRYVLSLFNTLPDLSHSHVVTAAVQAIWIKTYRFGKVSRSHTFIA